MHQTTQTTQVFTVFGGGYVPEQRADTARWNLATRETNNVVSSLSIALFDEVMTSLRSALSLK